jgi:hypothetical protein
MKNKKKQLLKLIIEAEKAGIDTGDWLDNMLNLYEIKCIAGNIEKILKKLNDGRKE